VGAFAAALSGACASFLIYNISPARIFMGDAGSLFIGFLMAVVGIKLRFPDNTPSVTWMVPVLVLGVPLFDTLLVTISRLRRGLNPATTPGTDHLAHRLTRLGFSRRGASGVLYVATAVLGAIAVAVSLSSTSTAFPLALGVMTVALSLLFVLDRRALSG
jgi:UDP-GlcNAc:undecaprenyl-phosphate GlcNAc-1-phosphate transferase